MVVNAYAMRAHMMNTWTTYHYIVRYIDRYSDFLIVMIGVGLASARPNNSIGNKGSDCTVQPSPLFKPGLLERSTYNILLTLR